MDNLEVKDSEYWWSIVSAKGELQSIALPKVVRTFEEFIKVDIYTGDSDPVYFAVARAAQHYGKEWATRFCVGMLTYYHTGTAVKAANLEGNAFWDYLEEVYPTAPRASERRHFRGVKGEWALRNMKILSPNPDKFFDVFDHTYADVQRTCAAKLSEFGPYFVLKICDYMDRCLGMSITSYDGLSRNLPSEPLKALKLMYPNMPVPRAFDDLVRRVQDTGLLAAPWFERLAGPAEVETSLCGWKTTKYKGNWFGADIEDKRLAFRGCGPEGDRMAGWMPDVPPRNAFKCDL